MKNPFLLLASMILTIWISICDASGMEVKHAYSCQNDIPPRLQWDGNYGYCGETSLISAGLYYGQYISQYDLRAIASNNTPQYKKSSQLLIGKNDLYAASQLHLKALEWDSEKEQRTSQFLAWIKENVVKGNPVIIGIYTNEFLFYGDTNPNAGDADYDHIVPVFGISSNHPLNDLSYYPDDQIYFSDNGLWGNASNPPFRFDYPFSSFQANRKEANSKGGSVYSLSDNGTNYGIAITGVADINGDTLPVRIKTNVNDEKPAIENGSNDCPPPMPLELTITVSNLKPFVSYRLYRYNDLESVPDSDFNAREGQAYQSWEFVIRSGSTYTITEKIRSDEIAIYRAVLASGP